MDLLVPILMESWHILEDSAVYMLFGFLMAGLLKAFLPDNLVARHLGGGSVASVLKASALGVPIPLCSCAVLPAAAGLREQRAGKGATASFLISTPETGVDSIAITYALLDPVMTVLRPLAAFITATVTGVSVNLLDKEKPEPAPYGQSECTAAGCGCSCEAPEAASSERNKGIWQRLVIGVKYAFGDLLGDIGLWFLGGVVIAGAITVFVSPGLITKYLGHGIVSMVLMLLVAAPIYVCATASTPIAAALALKGLSPGAAMVFLLAGPATNAASLTVIAKILGKRSAGIYLASIVVCSLGLGLAVNWLYAKMGFDISGWVQGGANGTLGVLSTVAAVILVVLILKSILPEWLLKPAQPGKKKDDS